MKYRHKYYNRQKWKKGGGSVQGFGEFFDGETECGWNKYSQWQNLSPEYGDIIAAQNNAAQNFDIIGHRQQLAQKKEDIGHGFARKHESGQ